MVEAEANKLLRKLGKTLNRESTMSCLLATATVLEDQLAQMPSNKIRYQLAVRLMQVILNGASFNAIAADRSTQPLAALASLSDNEVLTITVLGKIKALLDFCREHWERNRQNLDIEVLKDRYKVTSLAAPVMGKLGRKFDDGDLKRMFDVFVELTTDMTNSIVDDDERNHFAFAVLRHVFPPLPVRKSDPENMKMALKVIEAGRDPEIRNRAIIMLIRIALNRSDATLGEADRNPNAAHAS